MKIHITFNSKKMPFTIRKREIQTTFLKVDKVLSYTNGATPKIELWDHRIVMEAKSKNFFKRSAAELIKIIKKRPASRFEEKDK